MRRGTTPTHIFGTDIDLTDAEVIYITYRQNKRIVLEKTKDDFSLLTPEEIRVELTQQETLSFSSVGKIEIQIRARFPNNKAVACQVISTNANIILKEGVI